jgi:hypothetical protein
LAVSKLAVENFKLLNGMKIRNSCIKLPLGAIWHIRRSLAWIDTADIVGIDSIELRHKIDDADPEAPEWHRHATEQDLSVNGLYFRHQGVSSASITLFVRDLYRGIPKMYWLTPVVTLAVAQTLAHEVGHHLIAERGYTFAPGERIFPKEYEEEMAHRYSYSVVKKMKSRWYYRMAGWATKDLASWHYVRGIWKWKCGDYEGAAESWYRTFHLDPDRQEAIHWYKWAKEAASRKAAGTLESGD